MVKLYKDGDRMAVETNCTDPDTFVQQCSEVLDKLIEEGEFDGDWALQRCIGCRRLLQSIISWVETWRT